MDNSFQKKTARTVIVDPSHGRRQMVAEVMRDLGFARTELQTSAKELLTYLETERVDWVIMALEANERVNALHVLNAINANPALHGTRVSFILAEGELYCLPLAFELGLMSWHRAQFVRDAIHEEFRRLLTVWEENAWSGVRVAARYLRDHLKAHHDHDALLRLEESLVELHPGTPELLIPLAEAQFLAGKRDLAPVTLAQAELLDPGLANAADFVRRRFNEEDGQFDLEYGFDFGEGGRDSTPTHRINALGVSSCVIVDPDTAIVHSLTRLLKQVGIPCVRAFQDGGEASRWLESNPEPDLIIQEWRIPGVTGPLFVQRVRQRGFQQVPVVVISSLVEAQDEPLLQEMGVSSVLMKPFETAAFFRVVTHALRQAKEPTEQVSLERKIDQHIGLGNLAEAERLRAHYGRDPRIRDADQALMDAKILLAKGDAAAARQRALAALRAGNESVTLFNVLGKCLLKTNETEAALKCFERAQAISPSNLQRLCRMAEIRQDLGREEEAKATLGRAAALDEGNPLVTATVGVAALARGDTETARGIMAQMQSLGRLMAIMNNRAVAMIRAGRFEEGIATYKRTLEALPGEWSRMHDAVAFNLGLAFARYGELAEAKEQLRRVVHRETSVHRKAQGLLKRVERCLTHGEPLTFASGGKEGDAGAASQAEAPWESSAMLEVRRGQFCCYRVFYAMGSIDPKALSLLKDQPDFNPRVGIVRANNWRAGIITAA